MKRILFIVVVWVWMITGAAGQGLQLEQVLDRYYKAGAMNKMLKVQTIVMKGMIVQNDVMPLMIVKMRPDRYLMEYDVADLTAYQAYDGKTAWMTTPWTSNPKPRTMPEDRALDVKNRADFDGLLYCWKAKGHQAELAGTDTVENALAYKIKLTRKDGGIEYWSIDHKSFLPVRRVATRLVRGKEAEVSTYFRDYREIDGIPFPFILDSTLDGQPLSSSQFETIEINTVVDPKIFEMESH